MIDVERPSWLVSVRPAFEMEGPGGEDFWYLLDTMLRERKSGLLHVVVDAGKGIGTTVREGLSFSLENNWDDPDDFDAVYFFVGDQESSQLPVATFLRLLEIAAEACIRANPTEADSLNFALGKAKEHYAHR